MIDARFHPLPRPEKGLTYTKSPFDSAYKKTLDLLERELKALNARSIVIHAGFEKNQIRNDGWPLSKAICRHPAVELHFTSRSRQLAFKAYRFSTFEVNLRAIALALEALRKVDRYGVSDQAEQYAGWAQLTAPGESDSLQKAATLIALLAGQGFSVDQIWNDQSAAQKAYRAAAHKVHPDKALSGASPSRAAAWHELQEAKRHLDAHHSVRAGV